jgi:hypothetical protein
MRTGLTLPSSFKQAFDEAKVVADNHRSFLLEWNYAVDRYR